jgi:hypothetical protein
VITNEKILKTVTRKIFGITKNEESYYIKINVVMLERPVSNAAAVK